MGQKFMWNLVKFSGSGFLTKLQSQCFLGFCLKTQLGRKTFQLRKLLAGLKSFWLLVTDIRSLVRGPLH